VAAILTLFSSPLAGQQDLDAAWLAYRQAEIAYRATEEARDSIRGFQERAMERIDVARESGQIQLLQNALAAAQTQGTLLSRAELNLTRNRSTLQRSGEVLVDRLEDWAAELEGNLRGPNRAPNIVASWNEALRQTRAFIAQVRTELLELEEEVTPIGIPPVPLDPRTGPEEYGYLADLYERRARNYSALIADSDAQIRRLENLSAAQREQQRQALFDSNPTGGRLAPVGGSTSAADPLPGQIALEREKREIYIAARDAYLEQARIARAYAAGRQP
jgi:hypothetical protein